MEKLEEIEYIQSIVKGLEEKKDFYEKRCIELLDEHKLASELATQYSNAFCEMQKVFNILNDSSTKKNGEEKENGTGKTDPHARTGA